jgi:glucose-6-phosphate dehydrogenase assembly protein OpcA
MSTAVISPAQPEQILKGLGKLWTSLGEEEKQQGKPTVLRACAMTLIVATDESDEGFSASQTISELMREHPSRGIVLAMAEHGELEPEARVIAQCWKPFGKAQQICCEQIEIKAASEIWPKLGPMLLALTAADLPVVFWSRHSGAVKADCSNNQERGLQTMLDLATKSIVDTRGLDAGGAFKLFEKWRDGGRRIIADLEWTRLTPWREPLGHVFDNVARENKFSSFHTIEIGYPGDKPTAHELYMAGWLSAPYKARVEFNQVESFGQGLHRIVLRSDKETITFERTGCECLNIRSTNGRERRYSYTEPRIETLMTEELSIIGHDPAFESAFERAREILRERS